MILVLAAVAGLVIYLALKDKKKANELDTDNIKFPIMPGDTGVAVSNLQTAVNGFGQLDTHSDYYVRNPLKVDGIWGSQTSLALHDCFNVDATGVSQEKYNDIMKYVWYGRIAG